MSHGDNLIAVPCFNSVSLLLCFVCGICNMHECLDLLLDLCTKMPYTLTPVLHRKLELHVSFMSV